MKKLLFLSALVAIATFALLIAFSPGLAILFALILALAVSVDAVPWLKTFSKSSTTYDLTGHGHGSQADSLGAGGRHGPPRTIVALVQVVWAIFLSVSSGVGYTVSKLLVSAGGNPSRTNLSAQPLPS